MNDAIVWGVLNKLSEKGGVQSCNQPNGRRGFELSDKEFSLRRDDVS